MTSSIPPRDEVLSREVSEMQANGAAYVDVRTAEEYALGHVPGAYNVPWQLGSLLGMNDNPSFESVIKRRFSPDDTLILGCRTGRRAGVAADLLRSLGYSSVIVHRESWEGFRDAFGRRSDSWLSLGLPVEETPQSGRSYAELETDDA
jgi:rhodanese-related sulfurtransferase